MCFAGEPVGITLAVPLLVVMPDDRHDRVREVHRFENLGAFGGVLLHPLELGVGQRARLVEHVVRHRELADVVQQRRGFERAQFERVGDAQRARHRDRVALHAADVAVRHLILRVDGDRQRLDGGAIEAFDFVHVTVGILDPAHHRLVRGVRQRQQRHDEADHVQAALGGEHQHGDRRRGVVVHRQVERVLLPHLAERHARSRAPSPRRCSRLFSAK